LKKFDPRKQLAEVEAVFAALSHRARRQVLMAVHFRGGAMTAGDIARRFAHAWPTTTRHLHVLVEAGLLVRKKIGRSRVYRLDRDKLKVARDWLGWFDRRPRIRKSVKA
jgi:DNA-binding transcriptional ArsR family regulator